MSHFSNEDIRVFILEFVRDALEAKGLTPIDVSNDFDLLLEGAIDSFGFIELFVAIEDQFGIEVDVTEVSVDVLTTLGPLAQHIASLGSSGGYE